MIKMIALFMILTACVYSADRFEYSVFRDHLPRKEAGRLVISDAGISYRSDHRKTVIDVPLFNIFNADVSDPKVIRIKTYDIVKRRLLARQVHVFRLNDGVHDEALTRFLSKMVQRPVIGAFGSTPASDTGIRAYHRHRFGGCHGAIRFDPDAIRFESGRREDSRTWLYRDIENIGTMNPFHFRVSTLAETFNFDLEERLSESVFNAVTQRVYSLEPAILKKLAPKIE